MRSLFLTLCLAFASNLAQAQFNAVLYTFDTFNNSCDGSDEMLQDGQQVVFVYWDSNNNGPDAADVIAPDAFQAVYALNGNDYLGVPGAWYSDPAFTYNSSTPTVSRFYVVIVGWEARWTSSVFTIANGFSERDLTGSFSCEVTDVPCDEPTNIFIDTPGGCNFFANGPYYQCISMCSGMTITICMGPFDANMRMRPITLLLPGCLGNGCDTYCRPASFQWNPNGWVYNLDTGTLCNTFVAGSDGCACLYVEGCFPVEFGSFTAVPGTAELRIAWRTLSEDAIDEFRLFRDDFLIYTVAGTNTATGTDYQFLDAGLVNGQAYTYSIVVANTDGTLENWPTTVTATPSVDAAVVTEYALHQNYPNPFNPSTNLVFDVVAENVVNLTVYNAMGQEVATLVNGTMAAGRHTVSFDAANLTSGLYFYTVKIGNEFTATKKMLLVK